MYREHAERCIREQEEGAKQNQRWRAKTWAAQEAYLAEAQQLEREEATYNVKVRTICTTVEHS
jgi:hypothetical protein